MAGSQDLMKRRGGTTTSRAGCLAALRPAVLFDRDNTLIRDAGYTFRREDLVWMPGAVQALRALNEAGWLVIVATNQSGVARGFYTEDDVRRFHEHMQAELAGAGARIDAFYFCPFHADAVDDAYRHPDHPDRKPNPGMLLQALREHPIDRAASVVIGDQPSDLDAATAAGLNAVLYEGGDLLALLSGAIDLR